MELKNPPPRIAARRTAHTALTMLAAVSASWLASAAAAQPEAVVEAAGASAPNAEGEPESPVTLELGLDVTTAYFFHGFNQEDSGLIVQPSAALTFRLFQSDDMLIESTLGAWSSLHSQKTGAASRSDLGEWWYEADVSGGLSVSTGPFSISATYSAFASPSDAFTTLQELDLAVEFDDSELLGEWAFYPHLMIGIETDGQAADGSELGTYAELGVSPGITLEVAATEVEFAFPLGVGLSLSKYYQNEDGDDEVFGYATGGVTASVPLGDSGCVATAGVCVMYLGDHAAEYNEGNDVQVIGTVGLRWSF
jgi:hypothetical protein